MPIQRIKANKTASLTDLRDPRSIINSLEDGEVAILDRNKVVAYLRHPDTPVGYYDADAVKTLLAERKPKIQPVLDYLKDK